MDLPESHVALRVAKELLLRQGKDSNVIFSPLSIHIVLSILTAGSNGATRDQLLSLLNSKSTDQLNSSASEFLSILLPDSSFSGGPRLSFANGVWVDQSLPLNPSFKKVVDTAYKAAIAHVDFQTSVRLELVAAFEGFKVLSLPYKQGEDKRSFSMHFFLPDSKHGQHALIEKLRWLFRTSPTYPADASLFYPSQRKEAFRTWWTLHGAAPSTSLAYFTSLLLRLTNKASVAMGGCCAGVWERIDFVADHPFPFLIRENTSGTLVFSWPSTQSACRLINFCP